MKAKNFAEYVQPKPFMRPMVSIELNHEEVSKLLEELYTLGYHNSSLYPKIKELYSELIIANNKTL